MTHYSRIGLTMSHHAACDSCHLANYYYYNYYSWFIKDQDSQPMAELLTILHVWITIQYMKYKFTNKLLNQIIKMHKNLVKTIILMESVSQYMYTCTCMYCVNCICVACL